jgi:hypothetical protein
LTAYSPAMVKTSPAANGAFGHKSSAARPNACASHVSSGLGTYGNAASAGIAAKKVRRLGIALVLITIQVMGGGSRGFLKDVGRYSGKDFALYPEHLKE